MKFKLGDKVKIRVNGHLEIGEIIKTSPIIMYCQVKFKDGDAMLLHEDILELADEI